MRKYEYRDISVVINGEPFQITNMTYEAKAPESVVEPSYPVGETRGTFRLANAEYSRFATFFMHRPPTRYWAKRLEWWRRKLNRRAA